jgi:hypothetical protein
MMNANLLAWTFLFLSVPGSPLHAEGRVLVLDDFEDGDRRAASGLSWISISDDLMGGGSNADLQVTAAGPGSSRALRVSGELAAEGFAGAWVALDGRARAADASDFAGVRLRVRGPGTLQVAVRGGPGAGANYAAAVESGPDWKSVDVPFATLQASRPGSPPFDARSVRWMGVGVRPPRTGPYAFEIDDVGLYAPGADARLRVQEGPTLAVEFAAADASEQPVCEWKELARDAADDGKQKRLPDATAVAACSDTARGRVWFRIALAGAVPTRWLGANLALDIDGDPANGMAWWGTNRAFHFDRLVTVYGSVVDSGYEGMIGIADAADVQAGNMIGSGADGVTLIVDRARSAILIGIPASTLGAGAGPVRLVAAVGSAFQHNDDVPNEGAAVLAR